MFLSCFAGYDSQVWTRRKSLVLLDYIWIFMVQLFVFSNVGHSINQLCSRYYFDDHSNSESFEDRGREPTPDSDRSQYHEEKEMPIWWKIFLGILEFGIEVCTHFYKFHTYCMMLLLPSCFHMLISCNIYKPNSKSFLQATQ